MKNFYLENLTGVLYYILYSYVFIVYGGFPPDISLHDIGGHTMAKKKQNPNSARQPQKTPARKAFHCIGRVLLTFLKIFGTLILIGAVTGSIVAIKLTGYLKSNVVPNAEDYAELLDLDHVTLSQTSIIYYYDKDTQQYEELQQLDATENRIWVSYDKIPKDMVWAVVSIEDKRFFEHDGVDWITTTKACLKMFMGTGSAGGSTITQQLIKNLTQEDDVTVNRKINEIFRALAVEKKYSKEEILEWYLNTVYFGEGCWGVQSAAQVYFGKDVSELTAAECAAIAGITNNPSLYDPYIRPENNRQRQLLILQQMLAQGHLEQDEYDEAVAQEMVFHNGSADEETYSCDACGFKGTIDEFIEQEEGYDCPTCGARTSIKKQSDCYSYFVDRVYRDVVNDLMEQYDLTEKAAIQKLLTGGYRIYATIDMDAQEAVDNVYQDLENAPTVKSDQQLQSAIVVIDNESGDIVAMAGGLGEKQGSLSFDRSSQSYRSPGSSFKPVSVYGPALDQGLISPITVYDDTPFSFEDGPYPKNESRRYQGLVNINKAVNESLNTIAMKVLDDLGTEASYNYLTEKFGFTTLVEEKELNGRSYTDIGYAPLALGALTDGVTVREMAQAFATYPNNGVFREARTYTRVEDSEGNVILDNEQETHTAVSERAAFYVNYLLQNVVEYGTGTPARISGMTVAGKTGTSSSNVDRYFVGYTPYYTAAVWSGFDIPEQIVLTGVTTNPSTRLWQRVMSQLHEDKEYATFDRPDDIVSVTVCCDSGQLVTDACKADVRGDRTQTLLVARDDVPEDSCQLHIMVDVCKESGMIANEFCAQMHGNEIETMSMLSFLRTFPEAGVVVEDQQYVYWDGELPIGEYFAQIPTSVSNPANSVCTLHTQETVDGQEQPTDPTDPDAPDVPPEPSDGDEPPESGDATKPDASTAAAGLRQTAYVTKKKPLEFEV